MGNHGVHGQRTVSDFNDLLQLLNARPEWRGELRRLVLTDEILELPAVVRALAEAQRRTEACVEELARQMTELAEAQTEMLREQRLARQQLNALSKDMAGVKGMVLEIRYRSRPYAYFGTRYRNLRLIEPSNLEKVEEAYSAGQLTPREWRGLNKLDALMRGTTGIGADKREELLALEVSWVIDIEDVERAHERADILRRLGYAVQAGIGGHDILESAKNRARELNVLVALDRNLDTDDDPLDV